MDWGLIGLLTLASSSLEHPSQGLNTLAVQRSAFSDYSCGAVADSHRLPVHQTV